MFTACNLWTNIKRQKLVLNLQHYKTTVVDVWCDAENVELQLKSLAENIWSNGQSFKSQVFLDYTGHLLVEDFLYLCDAFCCLFDIN
jgi:hypothetical protein